MLEQVQSLVTAIEDYKIVADGGDIGGKNIRDVIGQAITGVWDILGKNNVNAGNIIDAIEIGTLVQREEYQERTRILTKAVESKSIGIFSKELLTLFGITDPDMFILRGKMSPIINPILSTKIKVSVLLKQEREKERRKPKKGPDLEGLTATLSMYEDTYNALLNKKSGIHRVIYEDLIPSLTDEGEFEEIKKYNIAIGVYKKKEALEEAITIVQERIIKLELLTTTGITEGPKKKILKRNLTKSRTQRENLEKEHKKIMSLIISEYPIHLPDIVSDIEMSFGVTQRIRKRHGGHQQIVTSGQIHGRVKRAMAIVIHKKFPEMKALRVNEGGIQKMIKQYEQIIGEYSTLLGSEEAGDRKTEIIAALRNELDIWEEKSGTLFTGKLDSENPTHIFLETSKGLELHQGVSIRSARLLRDEIIRELTSHT